MKKYNLLFIFVLVTIPVVRAHCAPGVGVWGGIVGTEIEEPKIPPTLWVGITALYRGEALVSLSTDTPISIWGVRHPSVYYIFDIKTNLPHVREVEVNGVSSPYGEEIIIPSMELKRGANYLEVSLKGDFKVERITLLFFRISNRKKGVISTHLTMYLTEVGEDPSEIIEFFQSRGWVYHYTHTPLQIVRGSIRFIWGGREVEGKIKERKGEKIKIRIDGVEGKVLVKWIESGGWRWQKVVDVNPPLELELKTPEWGRLEITSLVSGESKAIEVEGW